jgi:hypothetical protein
MDGVHSFNVLKTFEPYFHIGLGQWVYSREDYRAKLRAAGCEEVGTEDTRKGPTKGLNKKQTAEYYREIQLQKERERRG